MIEHRQTQMRVGVFIFMSVLLTVITIFFLGGRNQLFRREYHLKTQFEDISGLRVGAQVQLAGLPIGMVDQIRFGDALDDKRIIVFLSLDKSYQDRIRENSFAMVNTQGLLGDKIVSISPGTPDKPELNDNDWLKTVEQRSILSMLAEGGDAVKDLSKAAKSLGNILEEIETGDGLVHSLIYGKDNQLNQETQQTIKELHSASKELKNILTKINRGEGTIGALITDPSVYQDIRRLFGKLERITLLRHVIRSRIRDLELEKEAGQSEMPARVKK